MPTTSFAMVYRRLPELTAQSLSRTLVGVAIHDLSGSASAGYDIHLGLDRQSHAVALEEVRQALLQLGFDVAEAIVTEWLTSALEGALAGGVGGGALGAATKDPSAILAGLIIGAMAGAFVGSLAKTVKATYYAQIVYPYGRWHISPMMPPPPDAAAWAPSPY
jgi:hypothetical protein